MANFNVCRRRRFGGMHCAFLHTKTHVDGSTSEECILKSRDHYNLYPETNENGDFIFNGNPKATWDFGPNLIWESLTPNEHGLSYSPRGVRRPEDIHPLYHIKHFNLPIRSDIEKGDIGEIFGDNVLTLSSYLWSSTITMGVSRVERCDKAFYGKYDKFAAMPIPPSLRDYQNDIEGWINYTRRIVRRRTDRKFFLETSTVDDIFSYCTKWFGETTVALRVADALVAIKNREYVVISDLLENNGVSTNTSLAFTKTISMKTRRGIYKSFSPIKLWYYYSSINNMSISDDSKVTYKCNLVNYVLNNKNLEKVSINTIDIDVSKRFWHVQSIVKRAIRDGIININKALPDFVLRHYTELRSVQPVSDDYLDCLSIGRTDTNGLINPAMLYPSMMLVKNILKIKPENNNEYNRFKDFAKTGKFWNRYELNTSWYYFKHAEKTKNSLIFWNFIEDISSCSQESASKKLCEGEATRERTFAVNLLEHRIGNELSLTQTASPYTEVISDADIPEVLTYREKFESVWSSLERIRRKSIDIEPTDEELEFVEPEDSLSIDDEDMCGLTIISPEGRAKWRKGEVSQD